MGCTLAGFLLLATAPSFGQLHLPAMLRDSMVLQRDAPVKIWGWAAPGEKITVQFNRKKYKTITAANGKWLLHLLPEKAGGPYVMTISGKSALVLKEILMGDVWVCAGQSNMVHQLQLHNITYAADIASAAYPAIRQFYVPTLSNLQAPQQDLPEGYWKSANPVDVNRFSAVAYFFAKAIYEKYKVPIGLINTSVGGTPIEAWTSEEGLKAFPAIINTIQKNKDTAYINTSNRKAAAYNAAKPVAVDEGLTGTVPWFDTGYTPKGWLPINIPGYWEDQGIKDLDGIVWYRKELELPVSMTGMPAMLFAGRIVDADFLYINGRLAGSTGYQYPQRRYALPAGMLKPGKNVIVFRVINNSGKGGFVPGKPYCIKAGEQTVDLKGTWQYKVGSVFAPVKDAVNAISLQNQPTALFNSMTAPFVNYAIKGFLWYQGESNAGQPDAYAQLLPALIADWRNQWQQPAAPFLYVQLPNFMEANYLPSESQWAIIREAQLKALSVPNTAMAVAIDLGEWNDIHPDNKKEVGLRLALAAEKLAYGDDSVVCAGPLYQSAMVEKNKIIVRFSHTGPGLVSADGEALRQFAIAGADKKFVWAKASIEGNTVVVWSDAIAEPKYVRYAWADNPQGANLYNKAGFPASPFRTDTANQ